MYFIYKLKKNDYSQFKLKIKHIINLYMNKNQQREVLKCKINYNKKKAEHNKRETTNTVILS